MATIKYKEIVADLSAFVSEVEALPAKFGNKNSSKYDYKQLEQYVKRIKKGADEVTRLALKLNKSIEFVLDDYTKILGAVANAKAEDKKINWGSQREKEIKTKYEMILEAKKII